MEFDPRDRRYYLGVHALFALAVLAVWYGLHLTVPRIPTPWEVVIAFRVQLLEGDLLDATVQALYAILTGYLLAIVVGISLGLAMGLNRRIEQFLDPYLNALYVTPFAALVPAMILWFGTGFRIRTIVVFFFALFPIAINTLEGAKTTPRELLEVARSFGASRRFTIKNVVLPHEVPYVLAGLRLGSGLAVKGLVVTELLVAVTGFGGIISAWSATFRLEGVFSVVFVLMAMGVVFTWILGQVEQRVVGWDVAET